MLEGATGANRLLILYIFRVFRASSESRTRRDVYGVKWQPPDSAEWFSMEVSTGPVISPWISNG